MSISKIAELLFSDFFHYSVFKLMRGSAIAVRPHSMGHMLFASIDLMYDQIQLVFMLLFLGKLRFGTLCAKIKCDTKMRKKIEKPGDNKGVK